MGVADNKSYKTQYHFKDKYYTWGRDELPSLDVDPKINSTIKENPYAANVEVEKGELVLNPDLSAIFLAKGKTHKQGGMDVLLKPDSFVFSNDKTLAFSKKDHELYEFKQGGSFAKKKNTPAEVLKRNVDLKHYNTLVANLNDPHKDDLAKKSSALMLEKYIQSIGNVAYLQEDKKGLPDGIPDFSLGTAPVYADGLKEAIEEQKQYARYGGTIGYLPKMQRAGRFNPEQKRLKDLLLKNNVTDLSPQEKSELMYLGQKYNTDDPDFLNFSTEFNFDQRMASTGSGDGRALQQLRGPNQFTASYIDPNDPNVKMGNTFAPQSRTSNVPITAADANRGSARHANPYQAPAQGNPTAYGTANPQPTGTAPTRRGTGSNPPNWGLWEGDKLPLFRNKYNVSNAADKIHSLDELANRLGYTGPKDNTSFQRWLYDSSPENRAVIDRWHQKYQDPHIGREKRERFDGKIGIRWTSAISEILSRKPPLEVVAPPAAAPGAPAPPQYGKPQVTEITGNPQGVKRAEWQFTPWQRVSQGYNLLKLANVKREVPMRSHFDPTYVDPALVNPEQTVGDMRGVLSTQINSLGTLNPILRNAQAAASSGQFMNQVPGVRSQYDNQNVGIQNASRMANMQTRNNALLANTQYDQQYWREGVESRKNFNNMQQFQSDQYMNNLLGDVQANQTLAFNMLTMNNPAYSYDWNTGEELYRRDKDIRDVPGAQGQDSYQMLIDGLKNLPDSDPKKWEIMEKIMRQRNILPFLQQQSRMKKGGKVKRNPYK